MSNRRVGAEQTLIYGTAWSFDRTQHLVERALQAGYRAFDTACQKPQYRQDLVGHSLRSVLDVGTVSRADLWIQSKFTHCENSEPENLPYDFSLPLGDQVKRSVNAALYDLFSVKDGGDDKPYLDCLLLHAPLSTADSTLEVWLAMEEFVPDRVRTLGVSNVPLQILRWIHDSATIKPSVVQNRLIPTLGFDQELREYCKDKAMVYQAFQVLKGNPGLLTSSVVKDAASSMMVSAEAMLYFLVHYALGVQVLEGSSNEEHIAKNLMDFAKLQASARDGLVSYDWGNCIANFRTLVNVSTA
ncbi:MAG: hypothetical protein Q9198_000391 [Flavoplaca austrocitrina]